MDNTDIPNRLDNNCGEISGEGKALGMYYKLVNIKSSNSTASR